MIAVSSDGEAAVMFTVPPPTVFSRVADEGEIPRTAKAIAKLGVEHGWVVVTTFAQGYWQTQAWREPRLVDSIAVRMWRQGSPRLVAIWHDGKYHGGVSSRIDFGVLNSAAVKAVITGEINS